MGKSLPAESSFTQLHLVIRRKSPQNPPMDSQSIYGFLFARGSAISPEPLWMEMAMNGCRISVYGRTSATSSMLLSAKKVEPAPSAPCCLIIRIKSFAADTPLSTYRAVTINGKSRCNIHFGCVRLWEDQNHQKTVLRHHCQEYMNRHDASADGGGQAHR